MRCPYCHSDQNKVVDSRYREVGNVIRRRRLCLQCDRRFTTYERIEEMLPQVIKKDGRREAFDRDKIMRGIDKACEKLEISAIQKEAMVDDIERHFADFGEKEIKAELIGEAVMNKLRETNKVAYVRFASVYRSFKDTKDFYSELEKVNNEEDTSG
ncbi:MAG TPA: transcriptional regulator NrdR [bacterium]|nr:transcriptional regulator NrdR [bacterium]